MHKNHLEKNWLEVSAYDVTFMKTVLNFLKKNHILLWFSLVIRESYLLKNSPCLSEIIKINKDISLR